MTEIQIETLRFLLTQTDKVNVKDVPSELVGAFASPYKYLEHIYPLDRQGYIKVQGGTLWVKDAEKLRAPLIKIEDKKLVTPITQMILGDNNQVVGHSDSSSIRYNIPPDKPASSAAKKVAVSIIVTVVGSLLVWIIIKLAGSTP